MAKPDEIPQDVWDAAYEEMITAGARYFNEYYEPGEPGELYENGLVTVIAPFVARAILAERERCAKVASLYQVDFPGGSGDDGSVRRLVSDAIMGVAQNIEFSIRNPNT